MITQSARCGGEVEAIFNPGVLSNPKQNCFLTYRTSEKGIIIEKTLGKTWLKIPYEQL
ncbi:MAG: hypothetical protein BroJett012_31990 [Betaproteobacteria bacterium]|nr:MAG: hypothetical protein BroJett012_31990 [Betaproteobacteria bacterium]